MCESQNQFGFDFDLSRFEMWTLPLKVFAQEAGWVKCILGGEESN